MTTALQTQATETTTLYGFEARGEDGGWYADLCGEQNASNYLPTREAAEAELPKLARVLECDVSDVRVVEVRS